MGEYGEWVACIVKAYSKNIYKFIPIPKFPIYGQYCMTIMACYRSTRRFLVLTDAEILLVEPGRHHLGCGVVNFIGFLQVGITLVFTVAMVARVAYRDSSRSSRQLCNIRDSTSR